MPGRPGTWVPEQHLSAYAQGSARRVPLPDQGLHEERCTGHMKRRGHGARTRRRQVLGALRGEGDRRGRAGPATSAGTRDPVASTRTAWTGT
ncbi:hypothetical protein LV779_39320 [Streptomyces thinghirensis]|nr:hypothetical protein [Streptomyces thinghirensis]